MDAGGGRQGGPQRRPKGVDVQDVRLVAVVAKNARHGGEAIGDAVGPGVQTDRELMRRMFIRDFVTDETDEDAA